MEPARSLPSNWQLVLLAIGHLQQSVKVTEPKNQQLTILHLEIFCLLRLDRNLYTIPRSPASSACCGNKPDYMNEIEYQSILFLFSLDGSKLHLREKGQQRRWPWKGSERQVSTSNAFSPHLRRSHRCSAVGSTPLFTGMSLWYDGTALMTYSCSEAWSESCIGWSGGLWEVCAGHQNPCKVIWSNDKSKSTILFRRYITEYCPVLEGIYTRVLNVSGLEVSNIHCQLW